MQEFVFQCCSTGNVPLNFLLRKNCDTHPPSGLFHAPKYANINLLVSVYPCSSLMVLLCCVCVCQSPTLDQASLCTPGCLSDVAPRPAPPALGADSPDPEAPSQFSLTLLSPLSLLLPLILIQPGVPFVLQGLLACYTAPWPRPLCATPALTSAHNWKTVSPHKIISSACAPGDSCNKLTVFLVGGGGWRVYSFLTAAGPVTVLQFVIMLQNRHERMVRLFVSDK